MDEARAGDIVNELTQRGYIEERDGQILATRKWHAKLQAAAEKLNILAGRGEEPSGNPLVVAVTQALANENLDFADDVFDDAIRVLVTLELTRMGPNKRALAGFPDVKLVGDRDDDTSIDFGA